MALYVKLVKKTGGIRIQALPANLWLMNPTKEILLDMDEEEEEEEGGDKGDGDDEGEDEAM